MFLGADQHTEGNVGSRLLERQTGFPTHTLGKVCVR
jgi:hypothetical protein